MRIHESEQPSPDHRDESQHGSRSNGASFLRLLDPSFVLAAICTGVYYAWVLQPAMHGSLLHRYTTEHIVEYAIVALFIWGIVDILFKCANFPREFRALRQDWLPPSSGREPVKNAATLLAQLKSLPRWQQESRQGRSLREMLEHVTEKASAKDCREYHQRLIEREDDKLHADYTLLRFVIGVTPILGFLGTVVHFGTALSGMSFDEMTERLPIVVAEMGMAFNTTTVALAAAMICMFLMFMCERIERGMMRSIERFVAREVVQRFEVREQQFEPFLNVLQSAHADALSGIAATLERQHQAWGGQIDLILQRFDAHQQYAAQAWQNALMALQQKYEAYAAANEARLQQSLKLFDGAEDKHLDLIEGIRAEATAFREELAGLVGSLNSIARGEGKLTEVQDTLAGNLRLLQQSGQMDEALHGLTAAIHLLTIRHHPSDIQNAAA